MIDEAFVGRRDELARFAALLGGLLADRMHRPLGRSGRRSAMDPAGAAGSRVVLVHGLGGSGKSRLLAQFRAMTEGSLLDSPVSSGQVRRCGWIGKTSSGISRVDMQPRKGAEPGDRARRGAALGHRRVRCGPQGRAADR